MALLTSGTTYVECTLSSTQFFDFILWLETHCTNNGNLDDLKQKCYLSYTCVEARNLMKNFSMR